MILIGDKEKPKHLNDLMLPIAPYLKLNRFSFSYTAVKTLNRLTSPITDFKITICCQMS